MLVGDTSLEPAVGTVPIPGVIAALVALVDDHLNVALWPRSMEAGEADRLTRRGRNDPVGQSTARDVNRAHRKCRKRPANFQLQDDHRNLAGAGPDGDLAFEIGGIRLGEELLK